MAVSHDTPPTIEELKKNIDECWKKLASKASDMEAISDELKNDYSTLIELLEPNIENSSVIEATFEDCENLIYLDLWDLVATVNNDVQEVVENLPNIDAVLDVLYCHRSF